MVVRNDGRVLLLKRSEDETHLQGMWDVPGGSVDEGETPRETAVREAKEEAGVEVEVERPVKTWSYTDEGIEHRAGVTFLCRPVTDDVELGEEHTDFMWATEAELEELEMYEELRDSVAEILDSYGDLPMLVRDRVPEFIEHDDREPDGVPRTERLEGEELLEALGDKLVEEADEFRESHEVEELADILEVMDRFIAAEGVEWEQLEEMREEKRKEKGGFEENVLLRDVD